MESFCNLIANDKVIMLLLRYLFKAGMKLFILKIRQASPFFFNTLGLLESKIITD